jgi:hypothetical protein
MNNSMITPEGDLNLNIPRGELTWFQFLAFSRAATSTVEGWNSLSYWRERGLTILAKANFLEQWTSNCFAKDTLPSPREGSFKLDRPLSQERRETLPLKKEALATMSENGLITSLFFKRPEKLGKWNLLGFETPLAKTRVGQLKADLFGVSAERKAIGIIELKKATNQTDSPLMALTEAICYGLQTIRCKDLLTVELKRLGVQLQENWNLELKIAAPEDYWDYWLEPNSDNVLTEMKAIISHVNRHADLRNHPLSIENVTIYPDDLFCYGELPN